MFERLTIRTDICAEPENDIIYSNPNDPEGMYNILDLASLSDAGDGTEAGILLNISYRLAEYEDTGLSPAEVAELAQAKADGRVVVLPCKVGDAVWKIKSAFSYFTKPMEDRVERIIIYKNEILVCCTSGAKFSIGSVGKAVFLSREEAEKALEVGKP